MTRALGRALMLACALLGACTLRFDPDRLVDANRPDAGPTDGGVLDGSDASEDAELDAGPAVDGGADAGESPLPTFGPTCPRPPSAPFGLEIVDIGPTLPYGGGVSLEDLDDDSDLDLVVVDSLAQPTLAHVLETTGSACAAASVADRTTSWLGGWAGEGSNSVLAVPLIDRNVDLISPGVSAGRALRGQGGEPLWQTVASSWLPHGDGMLVGEGVAAGDINGDGALDVVLTDERPSGGLLLVTNASGAFVEVPSSRLGRSDRVWIADFDADGTEELLAIDLDGVAHLMRFEAGALVDDGGVAGVESISARELVLGDFDNDGDLDAMGVERVDTGGLYGPLAIENVAGTWQVRAVLGAAAGRDWNAGDSLPSNPWGAADVDLDGDLDVLMAYPGLLRNDIEAIVPAFTFATPSLPDLGPTVAQSPRVAVGDLEGDGDVDLAITSAEDLAGQGLHLLRNTLGGGHWLRVRLDGPPRNERGIGAMVCVFQVGMLPAAGCRGPGLIGARWIMATSAQPQALDASFGLPGGSAPIDLRVVWPSGIGVSDAHGVAVDRGVVVTAP